MDPQRTTSSRRLLRLGTGELVAAAVFALVAARAVAGSPGAGPPVWSALVPLVVILVQAGVYWLVRRRTSRLPPAMVATYRIFRVLDAALLLLGLAGVLLWWPPQSPLALAILAVWLFGVIEYLNYFVVRLAYPTARWPSEVRNWRTPQLVKDLNR